MYYAHVDDNCSVVVTDAMEEYKRMEREHDSRQPFIEDELIEGIKSYSCVTYRQLAGHINHWMVRVFMHNELAEGTSNL